MLLEILPALLHFEYTYCAGVLSWGLGMMTFAAPFFHPLQSKYQSVPNYKIIYVFISNSNINYDSFMSNTLTLSISLVTIISYDNNYGSRMKIFKI